MNKLTQLITAFFIFGNMFLFAQNSGDLDHSFVPWAGISDKVYAVALQPDGKVLVGGNNTSGNQIKRLNTDGSLDASFILTNNSLTSSTGSTARIKTIAVQSDGKILIGGHFERFGGSYPYSPNIINRFCLARLNSDGSVDESFQPSLLEYYSSSSQPSQPFSVFVSSIAIQSDGKILIGGNFNRVGGIYLNDLARLHPNGQVDVSFNANYMMSFGDVNVIKIQSDGNILLGGTFSNGSINAGICGSLVRIGANGERDSLFNATVFHSLTGLTTVRDFLIQPDGKIIVGGSRFHGPGSYNNLRRLNPDGTNDVTFSAGRTNGATGGGDIYSLNLQPDGKIIIGGSFQTYGPHSSYPSGDPSRLGIARINTNGSVDNTFNPGTGVVNNAYSGGIIEMLKLQPDGKIIIGGRFTTYRDSPRNGVARINNCFIQHTIDTHTICAGESFTWINGNTYTTNNNTATATYWGGSSNCDSIVRLDLTVIQPITTTDPHTICAGESFTWIDGNTYTTNNNTATHTLQSAITGCDSIVKLNLTVLQFSGIDAQTICANESIQWIDGNTYTTNNNTATHTLTSALGCDSIVTLNLTVLPEITNNNPQTLCFGESYTINGNAYSTAGTYTDIFEAVNGCDSTVTTILTLLPELTSDNLTTICEGESLVVGNSTYTEAGTFTDVLQSVEGCDSIVTTILTVNPTFATNNPQTICNGESYEINGNIYSTSGTYTDVLQTINSCDSTVTTVLTVLSEITNDNPQTLCFGESYSINGNTYSTTGTYTDVFEAVNGCDSTVITMLTVLPELASDNPITICEDGSYTINGNVYNETGIYTDILTSVDGCDSTVVTAITVGDVILNTSITLENNALIAGEDNSMYQWIDCNNNNAIIPGATEQVFMATETGDYAVILTSTVCKDLIATSDCQNINISGLEELSQNSISIYPNPTDGVIYLSLEDISVSDIRVLNNLGEVVFISNKKVSSIDLSDKSKGIYLLLLTSNGQTITKKIILQ